MTFGVVIFGTGFGTKWCSRGVALICIRSARSYVFWSRIFLSLGIIFFFKGGGFFPIQYGVFAFTSIWA